MENKFKVGDKVVKSAPYSDGAYCRYGGDSSEVSIGTIGEITAIVDDGEDMYVRFDNGKKWNVDISEIKFAKGYKGTKSRKPAAKNFRVTQRDCRNHIGDYETYDEAVSVQPATGVIYDIYQKVAEHVTSYVSKVKKVALRKVG